MRSQAIYVVDLFQCFTDDGGLITDSNLSTTVPASIRRYYLLYIERPSYHPSSHKDHHIYITYATVPTSRYRASPLDGSHIHKWPIYARVRGADVAQSRTAVQADRVVGCSPHVLEVDTLLCIVTISVSDPASNAFLMGPSTYEDWKLQGQSARHP